MEFPNGPYLHAKDLAAALTTMNEKKRYGRMLVYFEACNGGSMFDGLLPASTNIFATTAASPKEPSWGTYCPPQVREAPRIHSSCIPSLHIHSPMHAHALTARRIWLRARR